MQSFVPKVSFFSKYRKAIKVVSVNLLIIIFFGILYGAYLHQTQDHWSLDENASSNPWLNGLYGSVIVHTSVGFGDIYPTHFGGKTLVMLHALIAFLYNLYQGLA